MLNRTKKPVPKAAKDDIAKTVYRYFGQRISSDTAGPFPVSPGGFMYAICFYDHCTKHVAIYYLRSHYDSEVLTEIFSPRSQALSRQYQDPWHHRRVAH